MISFSLFIHLHVCMRTGFLDNATYILYLDYDVKNIRNCDVKFTGIEKANLEMVMFFSHTIQQSI